MSNSVAVDSPRTTRRYTQSRPLRNGDTAIFVAMLKTTGLSVTVSAYQAGSAAVLCHQNGGVDTHFRACARPMGIAVGLGKLAIGAAQETVQLHNMTERTGKEVGFVDSKDAVREILAGELLRHSVPEILETSCFEVVTRHRVRH